MDATQASIIEAVMAGKSVFFTGSAGVGKSYVLREIIHRLRIKHRDNFSSAVAVCGMTGIAASNIDGITLHSALGIGAPADRKEFRMAIQKNYIKLNKLEVLILDEVSMLSAEFLWNLVKSLCSIIELPQLVFCGDFYQLPPVTKSIPLTAKMLHDFRNYGYAFEAPEWARIFLPENCFELTKVYRQADSAFVTLLNRLRLGDEAPLRELARECARPLVCPKGILPTKMFPTNDKIDALNAGELATLADREYTFAAEDGVKVAEGVASKFRSKVYASLTRNEFFKTCPAGEMLILKVGAQVMLLRNLNVKKNKCNGSRGVVVRFDSFDCEKYPVVRFMDGEEMLVFPVEFEHTVKGKGKCIRRQVPLRLAWAISIHKSQGMTLDAVLVDIGRMFASGQAYVALSRARSMAGLQIAGWDGKFVPVDPLVVEFYERMTKRMKIEPSSRWIEFASKRGL